MGRTEMMCLRASGAALYEKALTTEAQGTGRLVTVRAKHNQYQQAFLCASVVAY